MRKYDPHAALDGGPDGLEFYRFLAAEAPAFLEQGGKLIVEFGDGQETSLSEIFRTSGWTVESIKNDYTERPRMLAASKRN